MESNGGENGGGHSGNLQRGRTVDHGHDRDSSKEGVHGSAATLIIDGVESDIKKRFSIDMLSVRKLGYKYDSIRRDIFTQGPEMILEMMTLRCE